METMRIEEIAAKALAQVNNDRYILASLIFERVRELSAGAKPLVPDTDLRVDKLADIAMYEIALGKIVLNSIEEAQ